MALIFGTNGNDAGATALQGTALDDYILGFAGNDQLFGKDGVDKVYGDDGNDFVSGGAGNDEVYGGTCDDELVGGAGADILDGSFDFDTASYTASAAGVYIDLQYGAGQYTWGGDAAGDRLYNIERIFGSQHGDIIFGRDGKFDEIFGDQGNRHHRRWRRRRPSDRRPWCRHAELHRVCTRREHRGARCAPASISTSTASNGAPISISIQCTAMLAAPGE